jgi:glycosyltransferase involved in cell wall biosynthesis
MSKRMRTVVIIPAHDEEEALPRVLADIPPGVADAVLVVDNGSGDGTAAAARRAGATVVAEPHRGYGSACLAGIAAAAALRPDVVVFLDADHSDHAEEMELLLEPIRRGEFDLVIGSRALGEREPGALLPQARIGNLLAVHLIRWLFGHHYTDLGPFRAIRWRSLETLGMRDRAFGWTAEMQVRAVQRRLRITEVPVRYRRRVGRSKISGTLGGTLRAGHGILGTIFRLYREG